MLLRSADNSEFDEIALQVVDSDNYDAVVDETILACLKGIEGADRTNMIRAITKELIGLVDSGAFELVQLPRHRHEIPTKLVLKVKYRADGHDDRHKARLVVQVGTSRPLTPPLLRSK